MRILVMTLLLSCSVAFADAQTGVTLDTLRHADRVIMGTYGTKTYKLTPIAEIQSKLNLIMDKYAAMPNVSDTWVHIRKEASDMFWAYFLAGFFPAGKTSQAYSVAMGPETMSQKDINAGKKILVVGEAPKKPGEFDFLRIVRNGP